MEQVMVIVLQVKNRMHLETFTQAENADEFIREAETVTAAAVSTAIIPTWVDHAPGIIDSEAPFRTVSYKRRVPDVVGRKNSDCGIKAGLRRIACLVGRLEIGTTVEALTEYLMQAGVKSVRCTKLKAKPDRVIHTDAFRISYDFVR